MTQIQYKKGDVTHPTENGKKILCHCCNSVGAWGAGVVVAISKRWKYPERLYRKWSKDGIIDGVKFQLGEIQVVPVEDDIDVINMIGQNGISHIGNLPPIRYGAIYACLQKVGKIAKEQNAIVITPKFGAGLAGGSWHIIERIIQETLCSNDIDVVIYEF